MEPIKIIGKHVFMTKSSKKGGAVAIQNFSSSKRIKTLDKNIL